MKFLLLAAAVIGLASAQFQGDGRRDNRCPLNEDSRRPTQLPHPTQCESFLKCHNGNAFVLQCPFGQHWNARTSSCDSPRNANCQSTPVQRPAPLPIGPPQRPNFPNPRPQIEHPDYLNCPARDTPGRIVYYPYHLNCSQFYQCSNGRAVL